ncbi:TPA: hypothetical protein VGT17_005204 [Vibrio harveyi]|nr:hypothetical protein [Vibrio harveyi]HEQ3599236.1 hypothetical protein [Vibrio harveyi]HEQ3611294.1 hypothetical protein [Vibrio harveyi]
MFKLHQKTTKLGIGLIGSAVAVGSAMMTGHADLIDVNITNDGVQISGLAGTAYTLISGLAGFLLGIFDEDKKKGKK